MSAAIEFGRTVDDARLLAKRAKRHVSLWINTSDRRASCDCILLTRSAFLKYISCMKGGSPLPCALKAYDVDGELYLSVGSSEACNAAEQAADAERESAW